MLSVSDKKRSKFIKNDVISREGGLAFQNPAAWRDRPAQL
jgi:hypothetical protein